MSAQQAFDGLGTMLDERYRAFDAAIARLPSWGEAIDNDVQAYVEGVRNVVRANLNWSFRTERYFGKRKDEVKSTCLISVLQEPQYIREQQTTNPTEHEAILKPGKGSVSHPEQAPEPPIPKFAPPQPPDGGLHAWLSVVGACLVFFNAWGLVQAFGAYQSYYSTSLLESYSASNISWIGTIQAFLLVFVGIVTGPIFDRGYLRTLLLIGAALMVFGMMMLSLATDFYQVMLAQGVCVGLGSGVLYTPALAQITVSFTKHRALAIGLSTTGVGLGGIV